MRTWLRRTSIALSLLCFAATVAVWIRSYRIGDTIACDTVEHFTDFRYAPDGEHVSYLAGTNRGSLSVGKRRGNFGLPFSEVESLPKRIGERRWRWTARAPIEAQRHGFGATHFSFFHQGSLDSEDAWSIPLWLPAAASLVAPGCSGALLLRRRQRAARGLCVRCGYDLRASPARCPECGAEAAGDMNGCHG